MTRSPFHLFLTYTCFFLTCSSLLLAGGPLGTFQGRAVKWAGFAPVIHYKTDLGTLGSFTNATATNLAIEGFQVWQNCPGAAISFVNDGQLPVDVTGIDSVYLENFSDGINPIIFDSDGSIVQKLFGGNAQNSVIGFAGSAWDNETGYYVEGEAVMNGRFAAPGPTLVTFTPEQFKSTFVHEFGHFLGLDHTQINSTFAGDGNTANDIYIPTMYPTSTDNDAALADLNPDDIAAFATLYPVASVAASTGSIHGSVLGLNGFVVRGVNVVAIDIADTLMKQYSTVTDYFVEETGDYTLAGLPPGSYWVRIEPIRSRFFGGSSVGPYAGYPGDLSFADPVDPEYYNGKGESADPQVDTASSRVVVTVAVGATTDSIIFLTNKVASTKLKYYGQPKFIFPLPSEYADIRYAVRFTPRGTAKLVSTDIFLYGEPIGSGNLEVSVHTDTAGSYGGVPGSQIGSSIVVPFSSLMGASFNTIDLSGLNITVSKDVNFHIVFEVLGAGDTLEFFGDDGAIETDRSSSYYDLGNGYAWYNFQDSLNYGFGYNLVINATIDIQTGVEKKPTSPPTKFVLDQNYPNPFNPRTVISYQLSAASFVSLKVYDILGREVRTLVAAWQGVGRYVVPFEAKGLSSGVYYYVFAAGDFREVKRMVLLK
ncbi:MAG: T9SS type A sorting domain-containing protein [Bacteroidota bacterium]